MTFRVDDLFVAVLPENHNAGEPCKKHTKCGPRTAGDSPCQSDDPQTHNPCQKCITDSCGNNSDCNDTQGCVGTKRAELWRDEQFSLLSGQLEDALAG